MLTYIICIILKAVIPHPGSFYIKSPYAQCTFLDSQSYSSYNNFVALFAEYLDFRIAKSLIVDFAISGAESRSADIAISVFELSLWKILIIF